MHFCMQMSAHPFRFSFFGLLPLFALLGFFAHVEAGVPVPRPAFVVPIDYAQDAEAVPGETSDGFHFLLIDVQHDFVTRSAYSHIARKVLSEAGLAVVSRISVDFEPTYEKVEFHRIAVRRKGVLREILQTTKPTMLRRENDLEMGMMDGRKTLVFSLDDIRVGDIVEHEFTIRGDNPIFEGKASGSGYLQLAVPVERMRLRILHPWNSDVRIRRLNGAPAGSLRRVGSAWERVWDSVRVAPLTMDYDAPSWHEAYPRIQWSEFREWKDVSLWAKRMYDFGAPLSPALNDWIEHHSTLPPRDRVRAALRLAQDSIRYLGLEMGVSSHQPASPGKVYARRFGDCKDKVFLFCALLKRMGLEADPALVNSRARGKAVDYLPSPKAFDHVIARVILDGRYYWFDATMQGHRGDPFQVQNLAFGQALTISEGGFEEILVGPDAGGRVDIGQTFNIVRWDSTAGLEISSEYRGAEAEVMRAYIRNANRKEMEKSYLEYYAASYPGIRQVKPMSIEDDTAGNRLIFRESYAVDSLCEPDVVTGRMSCSVFPREVGAFVELPARKNRESPYALAYPKRMQQEITIRTPVALGVTPDREKVSTDEFEFTWDESSAGNVVRLRYAYKAFSDNVPREKFEDHLNALNRINDNLGATLFSDSGFLGNPNYLLILFSIGCGAAGAWIAGRLMRMWRVPPVPRTGEAMPLGGMLILLAIGLILRPILFARSGWHFVGFLDQGTWNAVTRKGAAAYHPLWEPILLIESAIIIISLFLCYALLRLFFRLDAAFPKAFAIATSLVIGIHLMDLAGMRFIPAMAGQAADSSPQAMLYSIAINLAWIAYLFRSDRAKRTFVNVGGRKPETEESAIASASAEPAS
jgi:hypothetical protein